MKAYEFTLTAFKHGDSIGTSELKSHTKNEMHFVNNAIQHLLTENVSVVLQLSPFHSVVISHPEKEGEEHFDVYVTKSDRLNDMTQQKFTVMVDPETKLLTTFCRISDTKVQYFKQLEEKVFDYA